MDRGEKELRTYRNPISLKEPIEFFTDKEEFVLCNK
jgi:hypothetical protein